MKVVGVFVRFLVRRFNDILTYKIKSSFTKVGKCWELASEMGKMVVPIHVISVCIWCEWPTKEYVKYSLCEVI
jgi:hypothetical protein